MSKNRNAPTFLLRRTYLYEGGCGEEGTTGLIKCGEAKFALRYIHASIPLVILFSEFIHEVLLG